MEKPMISRLIDFFHNCVIVRLPEVPLLLGKQHLQVVSLLVIPYGYFFAH
jgi:hypothetical protein